MPDHSTGYRWLKVLCNGIDREHASSVLFGVPTSSLGTVYSVDNLQWKLSYNNWTEANLIQKLKSWLWCQLRNFRSDHFVGYNNYVNNIKEKHVLTKVGSLLRILHPSPLMVIWEKFCLSWIDPNWLSSSKRFVHICSICIWLDLSS